MGKETNFQKPTSQWGDPWLLIAGLGAIFALAAAAITGAFYLLKKGKQTQADLAAPGFALTDQQGRLTSLAEFRGKVVVLTFIDPECTQLCPLTTQSMVEAVKLLGPAAASQVQLLGVDANPEKTQVADVAAYTRTHELEGKWRFLTGSRTQLERIWRSYHVYVAVVHNDIEHTAVVFLIDEKGKERSVSSTPMSYAAVGDQAHTLAAGIARLLPDYPAVAAASEASRQEQKPLQPGETLDLTGLGPKQQTVVLGGAHAHLVVFFAGWLGQSSELSKNLATLDNYAALANRHGWPPPVAVDELTTEPSPDKARQELVPLAAKLRTPVVEDVSGRLADDYHVGDLPWFVLNSPSGNILWRHDGWISGADLDREVRAALSEPNHEKS
jgi:cytochrome oxidase Cu insertion factor (SCO1/SenC/PrrC family)